MSLQAQEPSCLSVGWGRAELPPVALEVREAVEIALSRQQSRRWQERGRQRSEEYPLFMSFCHNRCPRALSFDYWAIGLCIVRKAGL
jgi:hypothetical protein